MVTGVRGPTASLERRPALARLLAPVDLQDFFAHTFEAVPLHVPRSSRTYFAGLYGLADVEAALHIASTIPGHVTMTKDGATVSNSELVVERASIRAPYTRRQPAPVLDPRAVAARYDRGHTLLLTDAGRFSPRLHALCNQIQRETFIYVQANAYLTPPNQRGFSLHHDTHDTLVLQITGTKRWLVYDPVVELPIESQPLTATSADESVRTYDLHAGDTLYLPRGFRHECIAGAQRSLHLTLALLPVRIVELAEAALQIATRRDVELRRSLALGWHDEGTFPARLSEFLAERLRAAFTETCLRDARDLVVNDLFGATRTVADDALTAVEKLQGLDPSTRIALRDDGPFVLRDRGTNVELVVAGKSAMLPSTCAQAIRALASGPISIAAINELLPGGSEALVRLLVLEGIVAILPTRTQKVRRRKPSPA
jgi:bifunctional lysine-specific demethylase and histidyl-hydroxylase NO66